MLGRQELPDEYRRLARYQVLCCLLALEKTDEALQEAQAFLRDYPKAAERADVSYFAADAAIRKGDAALAVQQLRQALDTAPGGWMFLEAAATRLTDTLKKDNQAKEAAAVYRMLAGRAGITQPSRMLLNAANLEETRGDVPAAMADLQRLREQFAAVATDYREATLRLARLHADQSRFAEAAALIQDLVKREQGQDQNRLRLFSAYLAYLEQKLPDAESQFRQVLAVAGLDPAVAAEANYYLAATLLEMNREPEALTLFAAVLKLPDAVRPHVPDVFLDRLVKLFFAQGQMAECEAICRRLTASANPALGLRARLMLGRVLFGQNRKAEAKTVLEQLVGQLEADGTATAAALRRDVLAVLGDVYRADGQNDQAVNAFQACLAGPGGSGEYAAGARCGLAQIFLQEGRANQALQQATAAFVMGNDPVYAPQAMLLAIQILVKQGKHAEALTTWKELAIRFPAVAEARKGEPLVAALLARPAGAGQVPTPGTGRP
jgi:tetratricopeptide (TPR) repeat protein